MGPARICDVKGAYSIGRRMQVNKIVLLLVVGGAFRL